VNEIAPQIPFELFEAEPPSFENFLVDRNEEVVTRLYAAATGQQRFGVTSLWGGRSAGKTHLLKSFFSVVNAQNKRAIVLTAHVDTLDSPFSDFDAVLADDVDRFDREHQAWLFNAFNHVVPRGGLVLTTGATPPALWPIREDLRTRLASGLVFEVLPVAHEALPKLMGEFATKRGLRLSEEVLTYVVNHTNRSVGELCQTVTGLDRLSLSLKRPVTIPLVRTYLAQRDTKDRSVRA
jgi:DnaA-homolog protein